jgi:branched-chain amino acid transport system ATP-binding protein
MTARTSIIPALEVTGIRAGYGDGGDIVCGISVSQRPETIMAIIGPNGSGKSTFVKTLAGLIKPRAGRISIVGSDLTRLSPARRVLAGLAYVPQEQNIFRSMTVRENIQLATEFLKGRPGVGQAQRQKVLEMFPEVASRMTLTAGNLSGGQRQMLAFACAMLANPEVLLLDEPSAGLSPKFVTEIMAAVVRLRDLGTTVVLVEQNVRAALDVADDVVVLVGGRISEHRPATEIKGCNLSNLFMGRAA